LYQVPPIVAAFNHVFDYSGGPQSLVLSSQQKTEIAWTDDEEKESDGGFGAAPSPNLAA
jgi:hypothetical protein